MKITHSVCSLLSLIILNCLLISTVKTLSPDNVCTFHIGGKLFSLIYLQKPTPYTYELDDNNTVYFQFCSAFAPSSCPTAKSAYSFIVTEYENQITDSDNETIEEYTYTCQRYSSNSYAYLFKASYTKIQHLGTLQYALKTQVGQQLTANGTSRQTIFEIQCSDNNQLDIESVSANQTSIFIKANSKYGCPVFQVSSIWKVFDENWILIGLVLFVMGLQLLFFGRVTIETTIFIAAFLISFAILGAIFTLFVSPYSSTFIIYFAFLILLFSSTMMAYGVTKLVGFSIFFVGAVLGFILGMLVNSLFCKMFHLYSVWSLVVFQIIFTIPFGLLSFKYTDQIIIASSSLTGAYFIVRPISWAFGGFPNQFLLYQMIQTNQLKSLPWTFFLYLILIIALTIIGAMYQLIKLQRQDPHNQIQVNFIQQNIQHPIDQIKLRVDKLIERFRSDNTEQEYHRVSQLKQGPIVNKTESYRRKSQPQKRISQIKSDLEFIRKSEDLQIEHEKEREGKQNF